MKTKRLWNNTDIEVVEIDGRWYALYSWNGEYYDYCWETDENTFNIGDGVLYNISPVYKQTAEDEFEIVDYVIL